MMNCYKPATRKCLPWDISRSSHLQIDKIFHKIYYLSAGQGTSERQLQRCSQAKKDPRKTCSDRCSDQAKIPAWHKTWLRLLAKGRTYLSNWRQKTWRPPWLAYLFAVDCKYSCQAFLSLLPRIKTDFGPETRISLPWQPRGHTMIKRHSSSAFQGWPAKFLFAETGLVALSIMFKLLRSCNVTPKQSFRINSTGGNQSFPARWGNGDEWDIRSLLMRRDGKETSSTFGSKCLIPYQNARQRFVPCRRPISPTCFQCAIARLVECASANLEVKTLCRTLGFPLRTIQGQSWKRWSGATKGFHHWPLSLHKKCQSIHKWPASFWKLHAKTLSLGGKNMFGMWVGPWNEAVSFTATGVFGNTCDASQHWKPREK